MDPIALPRDEGLHRQHRHEWWYFCSWLTEPVTGKTYHYTTALMRNDAIWVSYFRWWPAGGEPTFRRTIHVAPASGGAERWIRPRPDWRVLIGPGHSTHLLGPITLHFRGDGPEGGPCLHTEPHGGGIRTYGGDNRMAWYSWPRLVARGRLQPGSGGANHLEGIGWMEHQWGSTDFRRLVWRYVPILLETPVRRRLIAYHYVHRDHPREPSRVLASLEGGALVPWEGGGISPEGPGPGPTTISLGARGSLVCTPQEGGAVDLGLPGVPRFHEAPSVITGVLDGAAVSGVAMTEYNPSQP